MNTKKIQSEVEKDNLLGKLFNHSNNASVHIVDLMLQIRKGFILGKINKYDYERQINLLSIIKLEIESVSDLSRNSIETNSRGLLHGVPAG